eukprot:Rmarinus@m.25675
MVTTIFFLCVFFGAVFGALDSNGGGRCSSWDDCNLGYGGVCNNGACECFTGWTCQHCTATESDIEDEVTSCMLAEAPVGGLKCESDANCNGGVCYGGTCRCFEGYRCLSCGLRDEELLQGVPCVYVDGWRGGASCEFDVDCNGGLGGFCNEAGRCVCRSGWFCRRCGLNTEDILNGGMCQNESPYLYGGGQCTQFLTNTTIPANSTANSTDSVIEGSGGSGASSVDRNRGRWTDDCMHGFCHPEDNRCYCDEHYSCPNCVLWRPYVEPESQCVYSEDPASPSTGTPLSPAVDVLTSLLLLLVVALLFL